MPMNRKNYPANWDDISRAARQRAAWKCEACGVPNGAIICRSKSDPAKYIVYDWQRSKWLFDGRDDFDRKDFDKRKTTRVVLTVHHVGAPYPDGRAGDPRDKMDVRPENLQALCQRCHLLADLDHHIENARITRQSKRQARARAAGQLNLPFTPIEE